MIREVDIALVAAVAVPCSPLQIVALAIPGNAGRVAIFAVDGFTETKAALVGDALADQFPCLEVDVRREPIREALVGMLGGAR